MKACGKDQHVQFVEAPVDCLDSPGFDSLDAFGDQLRIRMLNGLVEIGRHDQALAGGPIVGSKSFAQFRIADAVLQVGHAVVVNQFKQGRIRIDQNIGEGIGHRPGEFLSDGFHGLGVRAKMGLLLLGVGRVFRGSDPLRGPLEEG